MSSPPPTPPAETPKFRKEWRFHQNGAPCEWCELYRPGGYHPVHLGDTFKDGQYRVLRKLGDGSFSTVWLAFDSLNKRYVALKIAMAKSSASIDIELAIYQKLGNTTSTGALLKHVMELLDNFEVNGPNGKHHCLVYEPMGSTAASMVSHLPENQDLGPMGIARYPKWMAKSILKQMLSGLAFLHRNGIVHGDIQPGNLLFSIPSLDNLNEEKLKQDGAEITEPLERLDGKPDKWAPKYLALGQSLHEYVIINPDLQVKISDLASAFLSTDPPNSTVTPLALRAPELIFNEPFDASIDIWAFGCLIFEFLTGRPLFCVICLGFDDPEDADDDHLMDLNDVLEPLPDDWMKKWARADKWFGPNRERLNPRGPSGDGAVSNFNYDDQAEWSGDEKEILGEGEKGALHAENENGVLREEIEKGALREENDAKHYGSTDGTWFTLGEKVDEGGENGPFINKPLEEHFEEGKPKDMDAEEAEVVTKLIRQILQYEPAKRPTAAQLLEHPWFKE